MSFVLGREGDESAGPTGRFGRYRASDGSVGAPVHVDFDRPHAATVVGKRGYGKSYTLGVLAEGLARARGTAPVLIDTMGEFDTLVSGEAPGGPVAATVVGDPCVRADALSPRSWCRVLGLEPDSPAGSLVWAAATEESSLAAMRSHVRSADAPDADVRAASNHLEAAARWEVFDSSGITATTLADGGVTVVDVSDLSRSAADAVVRTVSDVLYRARIDTEIRRLPWLLVDEAHAFFDGVAGPGLRRILTRGRSPGVSLVLATQRPSAVPAVAVSQSDLLVAHRLTSGADIDALAAAQPTYLTGSLADRLPDRPGDVVVVDDTTESVHTVTVRERATPHAGESPRASAVSLER